MSPIILLLVLAGLCLVAVGHAVASVGLARIAYIVSAVLFGTAGLYSFLT